MEITVLNSINDDLSIVLKEAVSLYGKILMPRKANTLQVIIKCHQHIGDNMAQTTWIDTNIRPNVCEIKLANKIKNSKKIVESLAHEMVHVKQLATGEYYDYMYSDKTVKWKGKKVNIKEVDYWDQPWEIEAYGKERGLYVKLKDHLKVSDVLLEKNIKRVADIVRTMYNQKI